MALFNYATRELSAKVVYYGPGLSGKTTNIEMVHRILNPEQKGRLISLPTETDRTLFFDFLPLDLGLLKGFKVRFHLYTVPGQVFYNATRRLVLQGVDGVVFVADSQKEMAESNAECLKNLVENLATYGKSLGELPFVLQYNKRDLKNISSVQEMDKRLNPRKVPVHEGIAKEGVGVSETLVTISKMVFSHLRKTLLMPGEAEEQEDTGGAADGKTGVSRGRKEAEPLEEISEVEMIEEQELSVEEGTPVAEFGTEGPSPGGDASKAVPPHLAASSPVPDEIEILVGADLRGERIVPAAPPDAASRVGESEIGDTDLRGEKIVPAAPPPEPPASMPPPPPAAAPRSGESEIGDTDLRGERIVPAAPPPEPPVEEFDIEIPEPSIERKKAQPVAEEVAPERKAAAPAAKEARAGITLEAGEGTLTFLKFENPELTPEGHAVLPAVLMDGGGNIVRVRLRISIEE